MVSGLESSRARVPNLVSWPHRARVYRVAACRPLLRSMFEPLPRTASVAARAAHSPAARFGLLHVDLVVNVVVVAAAAAAAAACPVQSESAPPSKPSRRVSRSTREGTREAVLTAPDVGDRSSRRSRVYLCSARLQCAS